MMKNIANFSFHWLSGSPSMVYEDPPIKPEAGMVLPIPAAMTPGRALTFHQSLVEELAEASTVILRKGKLISSHQYVIGAKAGIDRKHLLVAADEGREVLSSTRAAAISTTTSAERSHPWLDVPEAVFALSFRLSIRLVRSAEMRARGCRERSSCKSEQNGEARHAGSIPMASTRGMD